MKAWNNSIFAFISLERSGWIFPCAIAFIVQWTASWLQPTSGYFMMTDSPYYLENAYSLLHEGRITDPYYPMGMSILLAPLVYLGFEPFMIVLWVHPVLHSVSTFFCYSIVRRFAPVGASCAAALCVAFYPPAINYSRQLISEPWFLSVILGAFYFLTGSQRWSACAGGLLLGFSVLVRTPALGIVAVAMVALLMLSQPKCHVLIVAVSAACVILLGTILASRSTGKLTFLTTGTAMATSHRSIPGGYEIIPENERASSYIKAALEEPLAFVGQRLCALFNIISPWPLGDDRSLIAKIIILLSDLPIIVSTLWAAFLLVRRRCFDSRWLLCLPALGLISFYTVFFAINRYRMPYYPPLICFVFAVLSPSIHCRLPLSETSIKRP